MKIVQNEILILIFPRYLGFWISEIDLLNYILVILHIADH